MFNISHVQGELLCYNDHNERGCDTDENNQ